MRVFIIHGTGGNPEENWFPWLKKELESQGHDVLVPKFPTPENQSLETWTQVFEEYLLQVNEETVFVGHSLAPGFILSLLEKIDVQVKGCIFVSGFLGMLGNEWFDTRNASFLLREFDWKKIKKNSKQFIVINSEEDPYVPASEAKKLAQSLETEYIFVPNGGHLNTEAGFTEFPILLKYFKLIQ